MAFAVLVLAGSPIAKGDPDDAALLAEVKQLAAQGQNAQTAAQVNQYVDQNQDAISAILKYLKQLQTMSEDDGAGGQPQGPPASGTGGRDRNTGASNGAGAGGTNAPGAGGTNAANSANGGAAEGSGGAQSGGGQASNGLRTSSVQASGGLRTSHLAGYPSLPDVDPTSSVTTLTAAQMEYAAQVQREMQERKQYLMQHPEGYTY